MLYACKSQVARIFGISRHTVYSRVRGIEKEIKNGRYSKYAISDGLINMAVFVDYNKYHKYLDDKNARKYVPAFIISEAQAYVEVKKFENNHETEQETA